MGDESIEEILKADKSILIREPDVITSKMIENAFWNDVKKGESERLLRLESFEFEKITKINLELQNILRIDHLWIMPNLTKLSLNLNQIEIIENLEMLTNLIDLNLSFNQISKIENLDNLKNLQNLSLYSNRIEKIENLKNLKNLMYLNIGNNLIETIDGMEELRFLEKLYSLKLDENPITSVSNEEYKPFRTFVSALLPNLKYYENVWIRDEERKSGEEKFRDKIIKITRNEIEEKNLQEKQRKYESLLPSFVENLDENQLFESLFKNDTDGDTLRMINTESVKKLNDQYRNELFELTQNIYKIGITKYKERLQEIETYEAYIKNILEESAKEGRMAVENIQEIRFKINESNNLDENQELNDSIKDLVMESYNKLDNFSYKIILNEIFLYEKIKHSTNTFGKNLKEIIDSLRWETQPYFIQLRDVVSNYADQMQTVVTQYFYDMNGKHKDMPDKLKELYQDDNLFLNCIYYMKYNHLEKIDDREGKLIERGNKCVQELIDKKEEGNLQDHKNRIVQIQYFVDEIKNEFESYLWHSKKLVPNS